MFHVVLVEPQIPPNTGNIGRLCMATGCTLHLVHPLGFSTDEKALRRAGMDYWRELSVWEWSGLDHFWEKHPLDGSHHLLTTKAAKTHFEAAFKPGDFLYFGREDAGLPEWLRERMPENCLRIPMVLTARSLNLSTAAGVVLYEAIRQSGGIMPGGR